MFDIETGQELELIAPIHVDGQEIPPGTKVRIGFIEPAVPEAMLIVVVIGEDPPRTLRMPRHELTMHARPLGPGR